MRKFAVALGVVLGMTLLGGAALADDVPDGTECAVLGDSGVFTGSEIDRGAVCVGAAGETIFYIGGEGQEDTDNDGDGTVGEPCGALIVVNQTEFGDPDWDKTDNSRPGEGHCD